MSPNDDTPFAAQVQVRPCSRDDLALVVQVERICFGDGALPMISFVQYLELFPSTFLIAVREQNCIGYVVAGSSTEQPSVAWLLGIAVIPMEQRQGVANRLATAIMVKLLAASVTKAYATVAPKNTPSLQLCRKMGFNVLREVSNYFGPGETRLLLELTLQRQQFPVL